ncbi:hypothetical protein L484_007899 [Morus notabilis]|uniref:Uncharacterized protein n=1 Tax=Morus notabilis TaxID=981085 RepID=W9RRL2_9ROSA|nr:uncharacterized protein LOC21391289 [Morus notabilis]EXC04790.1 hypothetical protein L484_007899 [Morus notabilis]
MNSSSSTNVQHVTKKSSDELLRKFAELDDEAPVAAAKKVSKRRRRSAESRGEGGGDQNCESPSNGHGSSLVESRSLLPTAAATARKSALLRQLGIRSRAHLRAREIRHKSLFGTIEKTWRRTIEGASKVFMEKHYNRHKRLISDMV